MSNDPRLDDCGCCGKQAGAAGPVNPPGLDEISFRAGIYGTFLRRLLAVAATPTGDAPPALTTLDPDDPSIALLDAAAVVGDVLTFYSERIANEAFLRTATERLSVLELARAVGYEMKPGVAASAYLAFEMAATDPAAPPTPGAPPAPKEVTLEPSLQVMSVPGAGEQPQVFETVQRIRARPDWNALRPRLTRPQPVDIPALEEAGDAPLSIHLEGSALNIKPGDVILFAGEGADNVVAFARPVHAVQVDDRRRTTRVDFAPTPGAVPPASSGLTPAKPAANQIGLSNSTVAGIFAGKIVDAGVLQAFMHVQGWNSDVVQAHVAAAKPPPPPPPELGIFVLRARTGFFGNNAPRQEMLPKKDNLRPSNPDPFAQSWDGANKRSIWTNSQGVDWGTAGESLSGDVYLDRTLPEVTAGSWAVFDDAEAGGKRLVPFRVTSAGETSVADYGISAKVLGLKLANPDGAGLTEPSGLRARHATAYLQSEKLTLAETPISDPVEAGKPLELDRLDLHLLAGASVALSGTRTDLEGVTWSEVLVVAEITHADLHTVLRLADGAGNAGPRYNYVRDSVRINANVALATHGETVRELLGSGSGAVPNQRFTLKRPPLTYTSAGAGGGAASSLTIRVNNAAWSEVAGLYEAAPEDEVYVVRRDNAGTSTVLFGDGTRGARLPSGANNITAVYRTGIGAAGTVKAGALSMLMSRPLGVRGVSNPLDAAGAAEPETRDSARAAAPAALLALDRVVSLRDFEHFARTFAGVGKARATPIRRGERTVVHLTVTSTTGAPLAGAPTLANLRDAIDARRDPGTAVAVADYAPRLFRLSARLLHDPRYTFEVVRQAATEALLASFAFAVRELTQPLTSAEVIACLSRVTGVEAVDLEMLDFSVEDAEDEPATGQPRTLLAAKPARWDEAQRVFRPAQILYIDPAGVDLSERT